MRMPGYGETQPRLDDDRMPVILVTLDGLGDRPVPELSGRTPAEAARTPVLDRLTARGSSGWHIPFGWGRAPASELAHWAMFGYSDIPFPGRAVLEGVGAGIDLPLDAATTFAALRTSCVQNGQVWITGRVGKDDAADADRLFEELAPLFDKADAQLHPVGRGEAVLVLPHHTRGDVTDSDPFFEDFHPWLQVTSAGPEATDLAERLNELLLTARRHLLTSPVNAVRAADGRPALDVMTTKWSGSRRPVPDFLTHAGVAGAAVTSTRLYRGIAGLLGMRHHHLPPATDHGVDMTTRIEAAEHLIDEGARFVHIHTKPPTRPGTPNSHAPSWTYSKRSTRRSNASSPCRSAPLSRSPAITPLPRPTRPAHRRPHPAPRRRTHRAARRSHSIRGIVRAPRLVRNRRCPRPASPVVRSRESAGVPRPPSNSATDPRVA